MSDEPSFPPLVPVTVVNTLGEWRFLLEALDSAGNARDLSPDQRVEVRSLAAYIRGFLRAKESS